MTSCLKMAFTILLTRSTMLHSSFHTAILESSRSSVETVWLEIQCFKSMKSRNRSKYNTYIVFQDPKYIIVLLQNTTFQNYALPGKSTREIYPTKLTNSGSPVFRKNLHSKHGNAIYFPLILSTAKFALSYHKYVQNL